MNKFKKGDKVVINDGSYSKQIKDNELAHGPGGDKYCGGSRTQYVVIEVGCNFPKTGNRSGDFNNTVIQGVLSGKVVFIEERFLSLTTHTIVIDGKAIKLSHESFLNLREQLV